MVRIDTVAPDVSFQDLDPADPELVTAAVTDSSSGLDHGRISIRRVGSERFVPLSTTVADGTLRARVPSDDLAAGAYELRAEADDRAGNTGSTTSTTDGSAMVLTLPLKSPVTVSLVRKSSRKSAGARVRLVGRVRHRTGPGLSGAGLVLEQRFAAGSRSKMVRRPLRADGTGRFKLRLKSGPTRTVRVFYAGSRRNSRSASRRIRVAFRDHVAFRLTPDVLRNGGRVHMVGSVRGPGAIQPSRGKLVAIQYFDPGRSRWRPVEVLRASRSGRFRYRYRFRTISSAQRILFRAVSLPEAGWPYQGSTSAGRSVIVHPAGSSSKK